jgi:hypothetical protein
MRDIAARRRQADPRLGAERRDRLAEIRAGRPARHPPQQLAGQPAMGQRVVGIAFTRRPERRLRREIRMYEELYSGLEERGDLLGDAIAGLQHKDNDIYSLVFHSGTPGLDPMSVPADLSAIDTLPDAVLTGRTAAKADSLLRRCADVDSAFLRIFRALSDSAAVLPPMTLPVEEISYPQVGASAGRKINPFYKAYVFHEGVDLLVPRGTPVHATADGTVVSAASSRTTGNTVRISHAGGYETVYCHLESLDVLDSALDEFLAYGQTTTSIIQSSPVPPRALPLPG